MPSGALPLFWKNRLALHGHTGWADPVIYAYDQQERLALLETVISRLPIERGIALDFGCGTGDFSWMLLRMGFAVCGYDPFVKPNISSAVFSYASSYHDISCKKQAADLVLSITALDHILAESELCEALNIIRHCIKQNGSFLMLEYALDTKMDYEKIGLNNAYQAFRTLSEWTRLLNTHGFRLVETSSVPHPFFGPSKGYDAYNQTLVTRICRRSSNLLSMVKPWRDAILKRKAKKMIVKFPINSQVIMPTPLKLIRCTPAN